jgi:hypothetical protein
MDQAAEDVTATQPARFGSLLASARSEGIGVV